VLRQRTRQEMWREKYRLRPYLQHSTERDVAERLRYIIENMTTLTRDGMTSVLPPEPHGKYWYELFEHVQEEYRRRGGSPPGGFLKGAQVPLSTHPISSAAIKAMQKVSVLRDGTYLVKFGRRDHMVELHEYGKLKISPAGSYSDPSLNSAIRDNELALSTFGLQSEVRIEVLDPKTGQQHAMKPIGNLTYTSRPKSDYYVYCMGSSLDLRLFADFGYDACVIVHDCREFERRLSEYMAQRLPGWIGCAGPVNYVDPFNCSQNDTNVFFGKHLKYWYQREYRCAWVPPNLPIPALKSLSVELGSMREISEVVVLDGV
jgi:hypothetical protein